MNVVICTHYYRPHVGGIEIVAENHARRLADRGHDVTVLTTAIDAPAGRTTRDGYEIVRYGAGNPLEARGLPYPLPDPVACRRAARSVVGDSTDLLHVHGFNYLTSALPLIAAPTGGLPVVLHHHTPFVEYSSLLNGLEWINDRVVGHAVLRHVDLAVGVSDNVSAYLETRYDGPVTTLFNGVDTERFHPDRADPVDEVLYLGRLTPKKGIDTLLDAAATLEERDGDVTIRIVGEGELAAAVETAARRLDTVAYDGFVDADRLPEYYSRARALVVPTITGDAYPTLTVLEALASGTPPLVPPVDHAAPGFVPEETYVPAPRGATALADAIVDLVDRPGFASEIGDAARDLAVEQYDWNARVDELEALYDRVGSGRFVEAAPQR